MQKRSLTTLGLIAAVTFGNILLYHQPLFSFAISNLSDLGAQSAITIITMVILLGFVSSVIFSGVAMIHHAILRPVVSILFIGNSVALFYMNSYGVVLDRGMLSNVWNTDVAEASELLHPRLLLYVVGMGIVPTIALWCVRVKASRRVHLLSFSVLVTVITLGWGYLASSTWLWIDEHAKQLGGRALPWSYVFNSVRHFKDVRSTNIQMTPLPDGHFVDEHRTLVVLVIGETARAQNFSLYGYPRKTNPLLEKQNLLLVPDAMACSTYTTASLRCMLSHTPPRLFGSNQYEPLPSYLQRQGVEVIWRTKNWGEPPLQVHTYQRADEFAAECQGEGCQFDEALLSGLVTEINLSTAQKMFVVLHQKGSHGPAYHTRYPPEFEKFKPVCRSVDLSQCDQQSLINAYDNTILYTDYVLNKLISQLKGVVDRNVMMIYISDHGESLGEHGLYLHGTPYSVAPDWQKSIPFLIWRSSGFNNDFGDTSGAFGHHNVFHTVMGEIGLQSSIYKSSHDVLANTRITQ